MNKLLPIAVAIITAGGVAATACTVNSTTNNNGGPEGGTADDSGTTSGDDSSTGSDTSTTGTDSGTEGDGNDGAAPPVAYVRLANLSPDAPTGGYALCAAPHGSTTFQNLGTSDSDAGTGVALTYPSVSAYFGIDPQQLDLEIVAATATDCSTPMGSPATNLPAFAANGYYTVVIAGSSQSGAGAQLEIAGFTDDAPATSGTNIRFLNMAPGITDADFGFGSSASTFSPVVTDVAFAALATMDGDAGDAGGTIDSNGYAAVASPASTFSAEPTGTTNQTTATNQTLAANSSVTIFLIGGEANTTSEFYVCSGDGVYSATSTCTIVQ